MANLNDDLDDLDFGAGPASPRPPEQRKSGNRNFWVALAILGGIFVLVAAAVAYFVLFILPQQAARNADIQAQNQAQLAANTATAQFATDDAMKAIILLSATPTIAPTNTQVVVAQQATNTPVIQPTNSPTSTTISDAQKATLAAQQTQLAGGIFTGTVIATSTALPNTGFADEVGLPGMVGLAIALIFVIVVARRLRATNPAS